MPNAPTLADYHAALNQAITDTFGVGRQEWRVVCPQNGYESVWRSDEEWVLRICAKHNTYGEFRHHAETRLVPLPFCGSLDAVWLVEKGLTAEEIALYMAALMKTTPLGSWLPLASAEERVRALLLLRKVEMPDAPARGEI